MVFEALSKAGSEVKRYVEFGHLTEPKCPHCGREVDVDENEFYFLQEAGEHKVTCPFCEQDFQVETTVTSYTYSTFKQKIKG